MISLTGVRRMVIALGVQRNMAIALTVATGALIVGLAGGKLHFNEATNSGWLVVI